MIVTTIIPVYNRSGMLREAVASVLAQTYRPIEIVIVDDGSTDDTVAVTEELARTHPEIVVVHQANTGPGLAREAGRRIARGAFIQHLDSDDLLMPRKFELHVAGLMAHPECGVSYGIVLRRGPDGTLDTRPWGCSGKRVETMFPAMLHERLWPTPAPLYRASLMEAAGPWSTLRMEEDWEYDARIAAQAVRLHHVPELVAEVRRHGGPSLSEVMLGPEFLRDRSLAHESIFRSARNAGITNDAPEMRHFAQRLFRLARQSSAAGLMEESKRLLELAREAGAPELQIGHTA